MAISAQDLASMAFLSWAAYDHTIVIPGEAPDIIKTAQDNLTGSSWTALTGAQLGLPDSFNSHGFYEVNDTQAIVATNGDTLIFAIRGSDSSADFRDALDNQYARYDELKPLFVEIVNYINAHHEITNFHITGHSLGGALAQYFAQSSDLTFPENVDVQFATFGSPGGEWALSANYDVLNFGHTQDYVFQHDLSAGGAPNGAQQLATWWQTVGIGDLTGLSVEEVNSGLGQLHRIGTDIVIDVPDVDYQDFVLAGQHSSALYHRTLEALAGSPFGENYLSNPQGRALIIDSLEAWNDDHTNIDRHSETQPLLIISDSWSRYSSTGGHDNDWVSGGWAGDWIDGGRDSDTIYGNGGEDILRGGTGVNRLIGGAGNDTLIGTGSDTACFSDLDFGQFLVTRDGTTVTVEGRSSLAASVYGTDILYNIDTLEFSDVTLAWNDPRIQVLASGIDAGATPSDGGVQGGSDDGSAHDEVADSGGSTPPAVGEDQYGDEGDNDLRGTAGGEAFFGYGGNDLMRGSSGQDTFDGGEGSDTVNYSYNPASVSGTVNLALGTADFTASGFYTETLVSIENVWMGAGNDEIHGNTQDNDLRGGPGDDLLQGGLGNDTIYGDWRYSEQGGNDTAILGYSFGSGYTVSGTAEALHIFGAEGDDWYYHVENFRFADGTVRTAGEVLGPVGGTPVRVGGEFQVTDGRQYDPVVTSLDNGDFLIVWEDSARDGSNTGIYGQLYNADGSTNGVQFQINSYTSNGQTDPSVASLAEGSFLVTWSSYGQDGSRMGVYGQRYSSDGSPIGSEYQINSYSDGDQFRPSVGALANGGFIVVWESRGIPWETVGQDGSQGGIYGQLYNADGLAQGSEFRVNSHTVDDERSPTVTSLAAGGFVVTWTSTPDGYSSAIYGQMYDADGSVRGSEFRVDGNVGQGSGSPFVNSLADGGFVVVWSVGAFIYGRRYAADGSQIGIEFQVSSSTLGPQSDPTVIPTDDGGFVVAWTDGWQWGASEDGSMEGIFGQRFGSDGSIVGTEFRINSTTYGAQFSNSMAVVGVNSFVVVWNTFNQDPDSGLFSQIFSFDSVGYAPESSNDSVTITASTLLSANLLADNGHGADSDPDGEYLTVTAVDGNAASVMTQIALASGALLTVNADGRFVYDPNHAFDALDGGETATDSFSYTVGDPSGNTDSATVTVTINGIDDAVVVTEGTGTSTGGSGSDQIFMGAGNDTVYGNAGYDWLTGGGGGDTLHGGDDGDWLEGGDGNDTLYGDAGNDWVFGDAGNDILVGGAGAGDDHYDGGADNDTVVYSSATQAVTVNLTAGTASGAEIGSDTLTGIENVTGGAGGDSLYGDLGANVLSAGEGDDYANGGDGADSLFGGTGNDVLYGGGDGDTFDLGEGHDMVWLEAGDTLTDAGGGNDTVFLLDAAGVSLNVGATHVETVLGGAGADVLNGASATWALNLSGAAGADTLTGGNQADYLSGGADADTLTGNAGNDRLYGDAGADHLWGSAGNDSLYGGAGADVFHFEDGFGSNTIFDWGFGADKVHFTGIANLDTWSEVSGHMAQVGANVVISDGAGNSLTLAHTTLASLDAGDFLFGV